MITNLDHADWITSPAWADDPGESLPVLGVEFELSTDVAWLDIAVGGLCIIRVNGSLVTDAVLEPGYANYAAVVEVTRHDLTGLVRRGTNTLVVELGPGMFKSRPTDDRWAMLTTDFGDLAMKATISEGSVSTPVIVEVSGSHWRATQGGTLRSSWTGGEDYDDRIERARLGSPVGTWPSARISERPPTGTLIPRASGTVTVGDALSPLSVTRTPMRTWCVDFGLNIAGWPVIEVPPESKLTIVPAEIRHPDGVVDPRTEGWGPVLHSVLTGQDGVTWHPRFMYNGFRYLEITGLDHATPDMFSARAIAAEMPPAGDFECSDPMLNSIDRLIGQAVRSNMFSVFTDCPQREKLGYLEQTHLAFDAISTNFRAEPILARTVELMLDAQREDGSIGLFVPEWEVFPEPWGHDINFGGAIGFLPWKLYRESGDVAILEKAMPALRRYLGYIEGISEARLGLLTRGLGDWNGRDFRHVPLVASASWYRLLTTAERIASALGEDAEADAIGERARGLARAIRAGLGRPDGRWGDGTLAESVVAADAGLVPEAELSATLAVIERDIECADFAPDVGEVAMSCLVSLLSRHGAHSTLFRMCQHTGHPGYAYMVEHGATALTETWDGPTFGFSQNHFMNGSISTWFSRHLLGIDQSEDSIGYRSIVITPPLFAGVTRAAGWRDTVAGRVEVSWEVDNDVLRVSGSSPRGSDAVVHSPSGAEITVDGRFDLTFEVAIQT